MFFQLKEGSLHCSSRTPHQGQPPLQFQQQRMPQYQQPPQAQQARAEQQAQQPNRRAGSPNQETTHHLSQALQGLACDNIPRAADIARELTTSGDVVATRRSLVQNFVTPLANKYECLNTNITTKLNRLQSTLNNLVSLNTGKAPAEVDSESSAWKARRLELLQQVEELTQENTQLKARVTQLEQQLHTSCFKHGSTGATGVNTEKKWLTQDQPGVYLNLATLPSGERDLERVRFRLAEIESDEKVQTQMESRMGESGGHNSVLLAPEEETADYQAAKAFKSLSAELKEVAEPNAMVLQVEKGGATGVKSGNVSGSPTWDEGLVFRGYITVSLGTSSSLSGTTSFTISLWVKVPSGASSKAILIQQRSPPSSATDGFNGEYQLYLADGARPSLMVFGDGDLQFDFSTSTTVNDGQWHHIVALRDGTKGRIYVDGKLAASMSGQVKNLDGNIAVFLGSDARDNVAFLTGTLSGVRIFSRALSSEEITHLSTRPEALVGWWKMDERSGQSLRDYSGKGATGTITGSTSWDQSGGLIFQGAGKVAFGTKSSLSGKTSFSIHAWVKVPTTFSSRAIIIQQRSPESSTTSGYYGEYKLYLVDGGRPTLMVYGDGEYQFDFSTSASINDGQWHHIIALRDGNEGRIYIDGRLSASAAGQVRNLDGNIPVFIGWDSRDENLFLTGSVRDVKVYSLPLGE